MYMKIQTASLIQTLSIKIDENSDHGFDDADKHCKLLDREALENYLRRLLHISLLKSSKECYLNGCSLNTLKP